MSTSLLAQKRAQRIRRHTAIRTQISGTDTRPRLSVYRSGKYIYAQAINDITGHTLAAASDIKGLITGTKTQKAAAVGAEIAKLLLAKNITSVVFDRGGFRYAGRIRSLAQAARDAGLSF